MKKRGMGRSWEVLLVCVILGAPANYLGSDLAIVAIRAYQECISPYNDQRCPYAQAFSVESCSEYGRRVIERNGLLLGLMALQQRLRDCRDAALGSSIAQEPREGANAVHGQEAPKVSPSKENVAKEMHKTDGGCLVILWEALCLGVEMLDAVLGDYVDLLIVMIIAALGTAAQAWPACFVWLLLWAIVRVGEKWHVPERGRRATGMAACVVCMTGCLVGAWAYYSNLPPVDYVLKGGWRQEAYADISEDNGNWTPGCCSAAPPWVSFIGDHVVVGYMPAYRGEPRWDQVRPLLHANLFVCGKLEGWFIRERLNPMPEKMRSECGGVIDFVRVVGAFIGLPSVLFIRPLIWTAWCIVVGLYGLVSPFVVGLVAAPVLFRNGGPLDASDANQV